MQHLRRVKCKECGTPPLSDDLTCAVCRSSVWDWHCERHALSAQEGLGCERCGFLFNGTIYYREVDLASALIRDWNSALEVANSIARWAEVGLGKLELSQRIGVCIHKAGTWRCAALTATLAHLNPLAPLHWRGRTLSQMDFVAKGEPSVFSDTEFAQEILASGLTEWIDGHPAAVWVGNIVNRCQERAQILGLREIGSATPSQWWWLLAAPDSLRDAARKVISKYVTSRDVRFRMLFSKESLTELEALTLATTSEANFLTVEDAWTELVALVLPTLTDLEERAKSRPVSRNQLEAIENELEECLGMLRKQREELRPREANLPDTPQLIAAVATVRLTIRESQVAHKASETLVQEVRKLVDRGHVRKAIAAASMAREQVSAFSDLSFDFVAAAQVEYRQRQQRLTTTGILLGAGIIIAAIIIKLLGQTMSTK